MKRITQIIAGVKKALKTPAARLVGRALVAGVTAGVVYYRAHATTGSSTWHAAIVAGVLAAAELFTPLNPIVGLFKTGASKTK